MSHYQKRPAAKMPNDEEPYRPSNDRPRNHDSVSSRSKAVDQIDSVPLNTEFEQGQTPLINREINQSTKKMGKHSKLFTPDAEMQKEEMAQRVREEKRRQRKNMKKHRASEAKQSRTSRGNRSCGLKKIGPLILGAGVVFSGIIGKMAYDGYAQSGDLDNGDPLHDYLNERRRMPVKEPQKHRERKNVYPQTLYGNPARKRDQNQQQPPVSSNQQQPPLSSNQQQPPLSSNQQQPPLSSNQQQPPLSPIHSHTSLDGRYNQHGYERSEIGPEGVRERDPRRAKSAP